MHIHTHITAVLHREHEIFWMILFCLGLHSALAAFVFTAPWLYVALVFPAAALALLYPRAGLLAALVTTLFFERFFTLLPLVVGETTYKLYPLDVLIVATLVGALLYLVRQPLPKDFWQTSDAWLFLFIGYCVALFGVSLFLLPNTDAGLAFGTVKQYVFYPLLVWLIPFFIRTKGDLIFWAKHIFVAVLGLGIFLVIGVLRGGGLWTEYTPLTTSGVRLIAFPHGFYAALAFLTLVLWHPTYTGKKFQPGQFLAAGSLLAVMVLASLMRHLWLGLGVVFTASFLFYIRHPYSLKMLRYFFLLSIPVVMLTSVLWFLVALMPDSHLAIRSEQVTSVVTDRVSSIGNKYDESLAWREAAWASAIKAFKKMPLTGIGFGQQVPVELGGDYQEYIEVRDIHNSWLALVVQTGVLGLIFFGGFIVSLLWPLLGFIRLRRYHEVHFIVLALVAFQSLVFLSQPYLETNLLSIWFWVTLGVARSLPHMDWQTEGVTTEE